MTGIILPTGAGAAIGAERALEEALKDAGLQREDIDARLQPDTEERLFQMVIRVLRRLPVMQEGHIS